MGYATTVHPAQGVTADAVQGLITGPESRQQLYTMLTSGPHRQPSSVGQDARISRECVQTPSAGRAWIPRGLKAAATDPRELVEEPLDLSGSDPARPTRPIVPPE